MLINLKCLPDYFYLFFSTENALYSGDHVSWHAPLDNGVSRLQHMLMTDDPQLPPLSTPMGTISFVQVNDCSAVFCVAVKATDCFVYCISNLLRAGFSFTVDVLFILPVQRSLLFK